MTLSVWGEEGRRVKRMSLLEWQQYQAEKTRAKMAATRWVKAALQDGLEWAVNNPDAFLKGGGQTIGLVLTDNERKAVARLLKGLLERLVDGKGDPWAPPGGIRGRKRNPPKKKIERQLAEHGARRGW